MSRMSLFFCHLHFREGSWSITEFLCFIVIIQRSNYNSPMKSDCMRNDVLLLKYENFLVLDVGIHKIMWKFHNKVLNVRNNGKCDSLIGERL